jgi:hypothetical protein
MCTGLRNKKYYFKNKEYGKVEYEKILETYKLDTFSGVEKAQKEFDEYILKYPRRFVFMIRCVNSLGDIISDSKNVQNCFILKSAENCKYINLAVGCKDSYDMATGGELSECYEDITCDHSNRNFFGIFSWKSQNVQYTQHCHNCSHVFGCVGLQNKSYCIFNKQYTKEEYEKIVPKIIEQMNNMPYVDKKGNIYKYGEFYPSELSYFGYNETVAQEQFPLSKKDALVVGYNWQDNIQRTSSKETLPFENIPESINEVDESILNEILVCIDCSRNYKIVPNELIFYKKMLIPIPRRCFYCRHVNRIKRRNPFQLWGRTCMCKKENHFHGQKDCDVEFQTSYAPDRPEIVYCEKCYQAEIY